MAGKGGAASRRAGDSNDIKAWIKARNDHVRGLRQNASRSGRVAPGSASSAVRLNDPRIPTGDLAHAAGLAVGAVRGAAHLADGLSEAGTVVEQILDPFYAPLHRNSPAVLPLYKTVVGALHAGRSIALNPGKAVHQVNLALNPGASPIASTVEGEVRRRFGIGQNQGELGFDIVAGMAAPEALAARALPAEQQVARWIGKGMTEPQARYMAEPYKGMGHHYYPRGAKLPKAILGVALPEFLAERPMPLPRVLSDSPFNVLKPRGISRGDMYETHFQADRKFMVARLPAHLGKSWNGKALGIQKHGLLGRVVHGAPPALKRTVGGAAGGLGGAVVVSHGSKRR